MIAFVDSINHYLLSNLTQCAYDLSKLLYAQLPSNENRLLFAQCLYRVAKYDECRSHLSALPPSEQSMNLLGLCILATKKYSAGITQMTSFVTSHKNPGLYYLLGEMHFHLGRRNEAIRCFESALTIDSNLISAQLRIIEMGEVLYRNVVARSSDTIPFSYEQFPRRRLFPSEINPQKESENAVDVTAINGYLKACVSIEKGDVINATTIMKNEVNSIIGSNEGLLLAARISCIEQNPNITVALGRNAARMYPFAMSLYPFYGEALYQLKSWKELHALAMKSGEYRWCYESWIVLGFEALGLNKNSDAVTCFEKALSIKYCVQNELYLANALMKDKQFQDALKHYRIVIQLNPNSYKGWCGIACASLEFKLYSEALSASSIAIGLSNTIEALTVGVIVSMKMKKYDQSIKWINSLLNLTQSVEIRLRKIVLLDSVGNIQQAIKDIKALREESMNDVTVRLVYARLLKKTGNIQMALEEYEMLKQLFPKYRLALENEIDKMNNGVIGEEVLAFPEWIGY
ncbi:tetratricopeptide repeat containing protein [Entamoeba histolytica HM-1:IMSS-B]|uniref:Uncharacterized protein n=6 Tax=Entamoeba histolytica TaxID=5759 RepID=C4LYK8_ENTH1|nr:uncharacterized protein EHI_118470 [Entamoeba histolytica HM-1:IMSS]EMD44670.1 O-linked N-acetylglucosamine transferase ogt, putative [Entamoeba histolytica KU27]EMH77424.1 tetratricopeptide repeat containing protein [Entamoeba histolytica HM-1:IMSS-B]EMS13214.1 O-linked N-acetylglucosamine transferase, ogt, putative [Entamoeba histolytica HM-3:IMSS]ENY61577.1 O-linked N-acetylglucosamine transferase, ogt, putative [Entamoeba histolytica HM-1:IMSS-A]GAT93912.1 hypothetical protein conserved|eukprot:XP_649908.1 uncharacterized protein EHI_118470 [Entamoeba histolytica HM-1:IMSS]